MSQRFCYLIRIYGLVQGVGMRPFLYKTAKSLYLTGAVKNKGASVVIAVSGNKQEIDKFIFELKHNPPPNARIDDIKIIIHAPVNFKDFRILSSSEDKSRQGRILPDLALCDECLKDVRNSKDRRFGYAFTNCIHCGPRYSILKDLPYDRANTSMETFSMCPECRKEYKNPENRRFHAQPNCCPVCGPGYELRNNRGESISCDDAIEKTKQLLKEGKIIAIKGIGGYHFVCNAQNITAVSNLRIRKNRPHRPFAVMAPELEAVKGICTLSITEEGAIANNKRPIVLLKKKDTDLLPDMIAPGLKRYGVMLPYSPIHYFLFDVDMKYLVMTSGNISGMPICYKDKDAMEHLNQVADYFLIHDREIMTPIDDSVVRVIGEDVLISRCGRGYSPRALPLNASIPLLSLGGDQKASVCLTHKDTAHVSQYLGDLKYLAACSEYGKVIERLSCLLNVHPRFVAHDLHPGYFSTQYAKKLGKEEIGVQHHHAHMASCMAEYGLMDDVIGIIFDGTGLGTDGTVWGGEFLVGNRSRFHRAGHLAYVTLQGGETAIKEPWKCAVSYLYSVNEESACFFPDLPEYQVELVKRALQNKVNCYESSSMGRLFDCAAALILRRTHISYEAQAAIELENIMDEDVSDYYNFSNYECVSEHALILDYKSILTGILLDLKKHESAAVISAKFHNSICRATIACTEWLREKYKINEIVLSGGVFENTVLLKNIGSGLKKSGFHIYMNKQLPLNDGGLSFGQASVAASILKEEAYVSCSSCKDNVNAG